MATVDLVIDLGSAYTTIFKVGEGIVLHEPTIVLIKGKNIATSKIVDYGKEARLMVGKMPEDYQLLYPVQEGSIVYKRATRFMLQNFVKRVVDRRDYFFKPKIRAFLNVPCGFSLEERRLTQEIFEDAGIAETYMLEAPLFASYGCGARISEHDSNFVVDIGGGVTDIALMSSNGIEVGYSFGVGGLSMDRGIIEGLESSLNLKIGMLTAENVKCDIGSLYPQEDSETTCFGKSYTTDMPKSIVVATRHIRPILEYYYGKIADMVVDVLKELTEENLEEIYKKGIVFTGGGSKIPGLTEFMKERLEAPIILAERAEYACIRGGANLLNSPEKINQLLRIE